MKKSREGVRSLSTRAQASPNPPSSNRSNFNKELIAELQDDTTQTIFHGLWGIKIYCRLALSIKHKSSFAVLMANNRQQHDWRDYLFNAPKIYIKKLFSIFIACLCANSRCRSKLKLNFKSESDLVEFSPSKGIIIIIRNSLSRFIFFCREWKIICDFNWILLFEERNVFRVSGSWIF